MTASVYQLLAAALAYEGTRVSVRAARPGVPSESAAIAEVLGPLPLRSGSEWWTLGAEGSSHVHLRVADVSALRFSAPDEANAALEILGPDGARLCRVAFDRTNPAKPQAFDAVLRARVQERFGHLAGTREAERDP